MITPRIVAHLNAEIERLRDQNAVMLAALRIVDKHLFRSSDRGAPGMLDVVRAAIAKAEGK